MFVRKQKYEDEDDTIHPQQKCHQAFLAVVIAYGISLGMGWENPYWAGFAVAMISLSTAGQSLNKGVMRMLGTLVAATASLILTAWFVQDRWWFIGDSLGWGIAQDDGSTGFDLLPNISPTFEWIRLAQCVPVRIHLDLDKLPEGVKLRVGTTVSVLVMTGTSGSKSEKSAVAAPKALQ